MSVAAIDRVERAFTWSRKATQIDATYRDVLAFPRAFEEPLVNGSPAQSQESKSALVLLTSSRYFDTLHPEGGAWPHASTL